MLAQLTADRAFRNDSSAKGAKDGEGSGCCFCYSPENVGASLYNQSNGVVSEPDQAASQTKGIAGVPALRLSEGVPDLCKGPDVRTFVAANRRVRKSRRRCAGESIPFTRHSG